MNAVGILNPYLETMSHMVEFHYLLLLYVSSFDLRIITITIKVTMVTI